MASKQEIIDRETAFWQAMVDRDVDAATAMMADTVMVTGAQGAASIDSTSFARMMQEGSWTLRSFEFGKVHVAFAGEDTAIIGYEVTEDLVVDGAPMRMVAYDASVWTRAGGGDWKCVLHTESAKGDPFGRDRKAVN